ncbi:hypothetical protein STRTUCAR8_04017 [Streptomyces turgidiscabies Car8]|uniref:Uncharacterized protein n=1 Tax=Streptomyces turgidiscabies (strain Car8) TaxID=698760 RepID=L7F886_STRT8|nr:hypothetical protein STRTUCAR8_04017 [Streptomyces turgidiscabies Car8]
MSLTRLAHGVDVLSQEKPSGSLNSGSGQILTILPYCNPSAKTSTSAAPGAWRAGPGPRGPVGHRAVTHC